MRERARARLSRLAGDPDAQSIIDMVYQWFRDLTLGNSAALTEFQERHKFIAIVGIARSGGSYLTAELFSALGFQPTQIPAAVAHDGFPDIQPTLSSQKINNWINSLMGLSEYLTMVSLFFERHRRSGEPLVIPKKLTKAIYAGSLFQYVLGPGAEFVVTVRHPLASCISTYEKSGGFPQDSRFRQHSNIEKWMRRDLAWMGLPANRIEHMHYVEAYLFYWENFYVTLAQSGLLAHRQVRIAPFGKGPMEAIASEWHARFSSTCTAAHFVTTPGLGSRHLEWLIASQRSLERVADFWARLGLEFPVEQLSTCT